MRNLRLALLFSVMNILRVLRELNVAVAVAVGVGVGAKLWGGAGKEARRPRSV